MPKFIAFDDYNGDIYGVGDSPEAAINDANSYMDDMEAASRLHTIQASDELAEKVETIGWDATNPAFQWKRRTGMAVLDEDE